MEQEVAPSSEDEQERDRSDRKRPSQPPRRVLESKFPMASGQQHTLRQEIDAMNWNRLPICRVSGRVVSDPMTILEDRSR